jgi:hypothetical protein
MRSTPAAPLRFPLPAQLTVRFAIAGSEPKPRTHADRVPVLLTLLDKSPPSIGIGRQNDMNAWAVVALDRPAGIVDKRTNREPQAIRLIAKCGCHRFPLFVKRLRIPVCSASSCPEIVH